jgi:hypothetical protein
MPYPTPVSASLPGAVVPFLRQWKTQFLALCAYDTRCSDYITETRAVMMTADDDSPV